MPSCVIVASAPAPKLITALSVFKSKSSPTVKSPALENPTFAVTPVDDIVS